MWPKSGHGGRHPKAAVQQTITKRRSIRQIFFGSENLAFQDASGAVRGSTTTHAPPPPGYTGLPLRRCTGDILQAISTGSTDQDRYLNTSSTILQFHPADPAPATDNETLIGGLKQKLPIATTEIKVWISAFLWFFCFIFFDLSFDSIVVAGVQAVRLASIAAKILRNKHTAKEISKTSDKEREMDSVCGHWSDLHSSTDSSALPIMDYQHCIVTVQVNRPPIALSKDELSITSNH